MLLIVSASAAIALGVDGELLREIAIGHRRHHLGDAAHLARQIAGHEVHIVGEVLPGARHALDLRLAAELALGADLARHPRHLRGEGRQLVHHQVLMTSLIWRISPRTSTVIFWVRSPPAIAVATLDVAQLDG